MQAPLPPSPAANPRQNPRQLLALAARPHPELRSLDDAHPGLVVLRLVRSFPQV